MNLIVGRPATFCRICDKRLSSSCRPDTYKTNYYATEWCRVSKLVLERSAAKKSGGASPPLLGEEGAAGCGFAALCLFAAKHTIGLNSRPARAMLSEVYEAQ
jgi:hypothetical protein